MAPMPMEPMPEDLYALYAEFGIAAEKAQVLETEAGNVALSFLTLLVNTDNISAEETEMYWSIVDDINRKTFGTLLKHIKTITNFDDSILKWMDEALEGRNYLTHHFFRTHNFALFNAEGRKAMVVELKEIQDKLVRAHAALCGISSLMIEIAGRSGVAQDVALRLKTQGKKVRI
jgi:hypothetical protein